MYSVWLTPGQEDTDYLKKIIQQLSERYQSPLFSPHLTVYSGIHDVSQNHISEFNRMLKHVNKIPIQLESVRYSPILWKTLFLHIKQMKELTRVNDEMKRIFHSDTKNDFNPHISLIYKIMGTDEKQKLINQLALKTNYMLGRLQIVKTGKDVESWSVIYEKELR